MLPPHDILFALCNKVRTELEHMKHMGAIKKVTEPSQWCAGVVTVPKSTGAILVNPLNQGLHAVS